MPPLRALLQPPPQTPGQMPARPQSTPLTPAEKLMTLAMGRYNQGAKGEDVYRNLGNPVVSAEKLKDAGIKGIQYLDQGSRAAGEGTRNFVIFDDKIIEIAKKYGISLPVAASLYKWQQSQQQK